MVLWGWGPHSECSSIPQPKDCKALSMWEVKAEFWKEEGCFRMRFVETAEAEGMMVSQLLSPGLLSRVLRPSY